MSTPRLDPEGKTGRCQDGARCDSRGHGRTWSVRLSSGESGTVRMCDPCLEARFDIEIPERFRDRRPAA
jgi:hypothetical protein